MKSFLYGAPIGVLGGLIGLGGAEFRLPVLTGAFGYSAKQAAATIQPLCVQSLSRSFVRAGHRFSGWGCGRGLMLGIVPGQQLKLLLDLLLIVSAVKIFRLKTERTVASERGGKAL